MSVSDLLPHDATLTFATEVEAKQHLNQLSTQQPELAEQPQVLNLDLAA